MLPCPGTAHLVEPRILPGEREDERRDECSEERSERLPSRREPEPE
jgi:hypothetical protein